MTYSNKLIALMLSLLALNGCGGSDDNKDITTPDNPIPAERTYAVFNPATSDFPLPNDILFGLEAAADGTMSAGNDPSNPVISGIDALDGNSVLAPIDIAFTDSLDASQNLDAANFVSVGQSVIPNPNQNIFLLPLSYPSGDGLLQASVGGVSVEVPTFAEAITYQSAVASSNVAALAELAEPAARVELLSLDGGTDNVIRITPLKPLLPKTKYLVVVTDVMDRAGNKVFPSSSYTYIKDPASNLGELGLEGIRSAIQGWEQLAAGYFGFKDAVYSAASVPAAAPSASDIIFSLTFTTTATTDILTSLAAPETFFEASLTSTYRKDAISKLVTGTYNVSGDNSAATNTTDAAINSTLNFLLTSATLPDSSPNALYNPTVAGAIAAGANYSTLASDPSAAYLMQVAAAEAAVSVHNSGDQTQGDQAPYVSIAAEAAGTVQAIAAGVSAPVDAIFPVPTARPNSFYRVDAAADILPALEAPALVYQGQITLPLLQAPPTDTDGSNIVSSRWQANQTIGAIIDAASGNAAGTTPPSDKTTYRFPFPSVQGSATVPVLATLPDETTLGFLGYTKPAAGWPVIINVHGITAERSTVLPVADAMAFACIDPETNALSGAPCFATVSIDLPLHGIRPSGSLVPGIPSVNDPDASITPNITGAEISAELTERHYNYTADAALQPTPMDYAADFGDSGSLYINLGNFENSRDTVRQTVFDLLNLSASLETMDVDGDGNPDFDMDRVYVLGISLGAINAITFSAVNNNPKVQASPFSSLPHIKAVAPMVGGGGLPRLLTNSNAFSLSVLGGLAAASDELTYGKSSLELYLSVFQGVLDSTDPMSFSAALSSYGNTGVLYTEVLGDAVIPNNADSLWGGEPLNTVDSASGFVISNNPAPYAGSDPMIALAGAIKTADAEATGQPAILVSRYTQGTHVSPGSPQDNAAVFFEMLRQNISFFALNGIVPGSLVGDTTVIED